MIVDSITIYLLTERLGVSQDCASQFMREFSCEQNQANEKARLKFWSMFLHAWDLANDGVDGVMEWMSEAGLNTMCLAANYHNVHNRSESPPGMPGWLPAVMKEFAE
jgi:hypothetical protein